MEMLNALLVIQVRELNMHKLTKLKKGDGDMKSKTESESFSYAPPLQGYLNPVNTRVENRI